MTGKASKPVLDHLAAAAERFVFGGEIAGIREFGNGNINDTFLVTPLGGKAERFILQRINAGVFRWPDQVVQNVRTVTEHVLRRLRRGFPGGDRRWETPRLLPSTGGADFWVDPSGSFWRAMSFIGDAQSHDVVEDVEQAGEIGWALGMFHGLISDLPVESLTDTLEGFHITPRYLARYDETAASNQVRETTELNFAARFVSEWRSRAAVLENAKERGRLCLRPIHGDPKVNNIMVDVATGRAVAMVDLDTVKPGLVHYDLGDCLRSACNPMGEETEHWEAVRFETDLCKAILEGYLPHAKGFFTAQDYEFLFDAISLIPFELGLRFLTDHLEGDHYFKVGYSGHNLMRALVQFRLTESIESQGPAIRSIIREMQ